jgi:hypothetical protein
VVLKLNSSTSTPIISMVLTCGTKIWPAWVSLVRRMSMRGSRPSCTACCVTEKAPVITAWLAMTVAQAATIRIGQ